MDRAEIVARVFVIGQQIYNAERARRRSKQRGSELKESGDKIASASSNLRQRAPEIENMGGTSHQPEKGPILASLSEESHSRPPLMVKERPGLHPETMNWQLQQARAELWELEGHLKHKCLGCGTPPTCCFKHGLNLIDIAQETKSMTTGPAWDRIVELGEEVRVKCHPDAVQAGTYFAEFPSLVLRTSELRRIIEDKLIEFGRPEPTLEEAKAEAAKLAEQEVEKLWRSQEKK